MTLVFNWVHKLLRGLNPLLKKLIPEPCLIRGKQGVINFVGVVPEQRGQGYIHDLLDQGSSILKENGFDKVIAEIDAGKFSHGKRFAKGWLPDRQYHLDLSAKFVTNCSCNLSLKPNVSHFSKSMINLGHGPNNSF